MARVKVDWLFSLKGHHDLGRDLGDRERLTVVDEEEVDVLADVERVREPVGFAVISRDIAAYERLRAGDVPARRNDRLVEIAEVGEALRSDVDEGRAGRPRPRIDVPVFVVAAVEKPR